MSDISPSAQVPLPTVAEAREMLYTLIPGLKPDTLDHLLSTVRASTLSMKDIAVLGRMQLRVEFMSRWHGMRTHTQDLELQLAEGAILQEMAVLPKALAAKFKGLALFQGSLQSETAEIACGESGLATQSRMGSHWNSLLLPDPLLIKPCGSL